MFLLSYQHQAPPHKMKVTGSLQRAIATLRPTLSTPVHSHLPIASTSRLASSSSSTPQSTESTAPLLEDQDVDTHYLITLRRSPLHLPKPIQTTCKSLGLGHRLASSIVPISRVNAGYILRIKELITVKTIGMDAIAGAAAPEWSGRAGEGRRGSGLHLTREGAGVIRVGTERSRGEERGFKVIS